MADDFAAWLFNEQNFGPLTGQSGTGSVSSLGPTYMEMQKPYYSHRSPVDGQWSQVAPTQHPMAVTSILGFSLPQTALSEEKRQRILDLIMGRFKETNHAPVRQQKAALLEGNINEDSHVLSLAMMQTYIGSYWVHFHPQMPILHRPTFSLDGCPNLLLVAVMALGAASLEKSHGHAVTQACAELSNFLAWYLRWEIFMEADFQPPAKLWIFQALLLLEIFEK
ncbi:hypothetical protein LTR16_008964, partial [Cryomyces antarcticus]